jgi:hypothetical protein
MAYRGFLKIILEFLFGLSSKRFQALFLWKRASVKISHLQFSTSGLQQWRENSRDVIITQLVQLFHHTKVEDFSLSPLKSGSYDPSRLPVPARIFQTRGCGEDIEGQKVKIRRSGVNTSSLLKG